MNEPWIHPGILGSILGGHDGDSRCNYWNISRFVCSRKENTRNLFWALGIFDFALSLILLFIGIIAYLSGQPRGVWFWILLLLDSFA